MAIKIKPHVLFVRVTENCNASCFMCGFGKAKKQLYISLQEMTGVIDQAKAAGIKVVRFTGGEPLLHQEITTYLRLVKDKGLKTSIITNGFLLPTRLDELLEAGVDQIITSLDGTSAESHDKLRNLPGAYDGVVSSIKKIKQNNPQVVVRVNTVVSPYNFDKLEDMFQLLLSLGVDQWSIIPLKSQDNLWKDIDRSKILTTYRHFQDKVKDAKLPKFLGYSKQWAGRTDTETDKYFSTGVTFTPTESCSLVDHVRFYIPSTNRLLPCNCVPWRVKNVDFNTECGLTALTDGSLEPFVEYLRANGPSVCLGCEPLNAYFGEHPEIINDDVFAV
jgi:cytosylglucuronate decarboxylase